MLAKKGSILQFCFLTEFLEITMPFIFTACQEQNHPLVTTLQLEKLKYDKVK